MLFNNNAAGGSANDLYFNNMFAGSAYDNADNYSSWGSGQDKGDQAIGGATSSSYSTSSGANQDQYFAVAYNTAGFARSSAATLTVEQSPLKWTGGSASWDFSTSGVWQDANSVASLYCDNYRVLLDDSASVASPSVTLNATVSPVSLTNNSSSKNYTISGTGKVSGGANLTKAGTGKLTLATANDYTGDTTVTAGTLALGGAAVIPSGTGKGNVNVSGGTLDLAGNNQTINGLSGSGTVTNSVAGTGTLTVGSNDQTSSFGGVFRNGTGTLALNKSGAGTLTLSGANTHNGDTTITAGTLALSGSGSIANSPNLIVGSAGTLNASGHSDGTLTVASGQTLKGKGNVVGVVAVGSGATLAPGSSVGALTNTGVVLLQGGGTNVVEVIDAPNAPGVGYDLMSVTGDIGVQSANTNPFTIKLTSLNGAGAAGTVTNFNNDNTYTWTIATATGSVTNFSAAAFNLDNSAFSNDLAGGQFLMEAGSLKVRFTNNHAPAALATNLVRTHGLSLKVRIPDMMANLTSDADGQARLLQRFESVSGTFKSARGYTVTTNSTFLFYTNTVDDSADSINYVILDQAPYRAGDTRRYATNSLVITVQTEIASTNNLFITVLGSGTNRLQFAGVPGLTYVAQYATNLGPSAVWVNLATTNAPSSGVWTVIDDQATNDSRFYRSKWQASP